jgi:hypothetical protein
MERMRPWGDGKYVRPNRVIHKYHPRGVHHYRDDNGTLRCLHIKQLNMLTRSKEIASTRFLREACDFAPIIEIEVIVEMGIDAC